jgi:shikimate kinase
MKIVLTGYRAAGKSTVGGLVAQQLGWPYMDVDRGIEERIGTSISDYYAEFGEQGYRPVETAVVVEMCEQDRCVLAFGAGSLMREPNRKAAQRDALVVYLKATVEELWRRIQGDPQSAATRPNLSGGGREEVAEMLAQREPVYEACADLILDAALPPERIADEIVAAYRMKVG